MKARVVLTCRWPDEVEAIMRKRFDTVIASGSTASANAEIVKACGSHDAAVLASTSGDRLDAEFLRALPRSVQLIANFGAGTDNIDLASAVNRGIAVSNTPDVVTACTADLAMGLIISACRQFYRAEQILRSGDWNGFALTDYFGTRVSGKTLGIIGLGRIGRAVAKRAAGFEMNIVYRTPRRDRNFERKSGARFAPDLLSLLRSVDILTLHCGLNSNTRHILDADTLPMMRQGAVLINTGRGALVAEQALIDALRTRHLAAAGLDVYEYEPTVCEELRTMEHVTLLPHIGTATSESRREMGLRVVENITTFLATGKALDIVVDGSDRPTY